MMALVTSLTGDVASLTGDVASLNGDVASLNGDMTSLLCPDGWQKLGGNCYFFSHKALNFNQAKDFCHEKNARIFEPRNEHINDLILDAAKMEFKDKNNYWIGIKKISPHNWKWVNDNSSPVSWFNWHHSQPNNDGDCARVLGSWEGKWFDGSCS